jgi:hypothetical protein
MRTPFLAVAGVANAMTIAAHDSASADRRCLEAVMRRTLPERRLRGIRRDPQVVFRRARCAALPAVARVRRVAT